MAKKETRGRPKKPFNEKYGKMVGARLLPAEYPLIAAAAKDAGKSMSSWLRGALLAAAAK